MRISADDHVRISAAIAEAEATTSGEIFCVVANQVSSYRDVTLTWAAALALIAPLILIGLGFDAGWLPGMGQGWSAEHLSAARVQDAALVGACVAVQALIFGIVCGLGLIPAVARVLAPSRLRRARVRRAALAQFMAHGLHLTRERTGVLIFAALRDHQVEVIADQAIHSRVGEEVWAEAVDALLKGMRTRQPADGFVAAIALCGGVLSREFPPRTDNPDELANRLVEL